MSETAIIYCRVSTKEQVKNLSLPTQEKKCRAYCKEEGYRVDRVFVEEGESAKTVDRPVLQELLTYCRENKHRIDALIVYDVTRFARKRHDHAVLRALLLTFGITLRSATEAIGDSTVGQMLEGLFSTLAQFDNDMRADRTKSGMKEAKSRGRCTHQGPRGYLNSKDRSGPSLIHDPENGPLVLRLFEAHATGKETLASLERLAASLGLKSKKGNALSAQTIRKMLSNRIYCGRVISEDWGIDVEGDFEPLIPQHLFDRVQAVLARKGTAPSATRARDNPKYPLRRFVRCAWCDTPMTGSDSKNHQKNPYGYYWCRKPRCIDGKEGVRVKREDLHDAFLDLLRELRPKVQFVSLFKEVVLDLWKNRHAEARGRRRDLTQRLDDLQHRSDQLDEVFLYGKKIDDQTYERQRDKLRQEEAMVRVSISEAEEEELDIEGILHFAEKLLADPARVWMDSSLAHRKRLQWFLYPEGLTFDGERFGTPLTSPLFTWLRSLEDEKEEMVTPRGFEPLLPG